MDSLADCRTELAFTFTCREYGKHVNPEEGHVSSSTFIKMPSGWRHLILPIKTNHYATVIRLQVINKSSNFTVFHYRLLFLAWF